MNKNLLFGLLTLFSSGLFAQHPLPPGVDTLGGNSRLPSFMLLDKSNALWLGQGGFINGTTRYSKGLDCYRNGKWTTVFGSGTFTDAIELNNTLYFAAMDALYIYDGLKFTVDYGTIRNTSIAEYQGKIITGTFGLGISERNSGGYRRIPVAVNGVKYDSIYSIAAIENELWMGTTNGVVMYDGNTFRHYSLPEVKTKDQSILKDNNNILSVKKDGTGNVWALNMNSADSLNYLFVLPYGNTAFISVADFYSKQCITKYLFPSSGEKLSLNSKGHIVIGTDWMALELTKDSIHSYLIDKPSTGFYKLFLRPAFPYCDRFDNIYLGTYFNGIYKINPGTYSNLQFAQIPNIHFNTIDINDIKSAIGNTGIHFYHINRENPTLNLQVFNVPSTGCATPLFASAIWMGGLESGSGDLHLAAETYRQTGNDFKPGPIDTVSMLYDSVANKYYNRIWKINRETIDNFRANRNKPFYIIPKEIMDWPAHGKGNFSRQMAPFVDVNQDGLYEPVKGDYPLIKGDQMLWWVFNDLGKHTESQGKPLGVEVHGSCYAYYQKDLTTDDSDAIINRTVFFNYKIINRSKNDYKQFWTGIFNDVDLGNYVDDYMGCDTAMNTGFGYNGDNFDEGKYGYGKNPPVLLCKLLNRKMNSFKYYNNNYDPVNGNPEIDSHYYYYMQGRFQTGDSVKINKTEFTRFYSPVSMCDSYYREKKLYSAADRRYVMGSEQSVFQKGYTMELEFAYALLHDPSFDFLDEGCSKPKKALEKLQNWYDHNTFPSKPYDSLFYDSKIPKYRFLIYPNPASSQISIATEFDLKEMQSLEIIDNTGRVVAKFLPYGLNGQYSTTVDISYFAAGIYIVKLNHAGGTMLEKLVKE